MGDTIQDGLPHALPPSISLRNVVRDPHHDFYIIAQGPTYTTLPLVLVNAVDMISAARSYFNENIRHVPE